MEIKYTQAPTPNKKPCFMENGFGEIFLVTKSPDKERFFVTRISGEPEDMETWESDLKGYKPLPKGTKVELIN